MNYAIVFRLLGYILMIEGALLLLPAAASLIYGEWMVLAVFLLTAAVSAGIGFALRAIKPRSKVFYMREGFTATALSWIVISVVGAAPFVLTGCIPNPVDALFETVSGFTTTGASILPEVESLPKGILFWRSFTHWIGGMGVLVFLLSLLPLTGGSHVNLMKAESPGPQVDKLVPKVQSTAKILYGIYLALTLLELVFLLAGGMPLFEAMLTSFGTAGTGGFGFRNDSFASFSPYIQWVVTVFMILFGVNFNAYFLLLMRKFRRAAASEEVRGYFVVILAAVAVITANIYSLYNSFGEALRQAAFQVGSIITTTGFSSCDFDLWPTLSKEVLVVLMFIGACAGSTGGGIKVSRILILGKTLGKELKQALHPQVVAPARMDGKLLNHETIRTTNVFIGAYIFIFITSFLLISLNGFDMVTNFTAVAATMNNIGPGLELVGPMRNFSGFADPAKLVLIFDMLAGRLEDLPHAGAVPARHLAQILIVQRNLKGTTRCGRPLCHACVLQAKRVQYNCWKTNAFDRKDCYGIRFLYAGRPLPGLLVCGLGRGDGSSYGAGQAFCQPRRSSRALLLCVRLHGGTAGRGLHGPAQRPGVPLLCLYAGLHGHGVADG